MVDQREPVSSDIVEIVSVEESVTRDICMGLAWVICFPLMMIRHRMKGGYARFIIAEFQKKHPEDSIVEIRQQKVAIKKVKSFTVTTRKGQTYQLSYNKADKVVSWSAH